VLKRWCESLVIWQPSPLGEQRRSWRSELIFRGRKDYASVSYGGSEGTMAGNHGIFHNKCADCARSAWQ
jgi:hypothetical protein